jgi:prepilin-type N-terminal cleavage/methylation domain-containing protein
VKKNSRRPKQKKFGFTLIELLLVIFIIASLGAMAIPMSSSFLLKSYLRNKTNELVSSLQTARLNTLIGKEDSQWGVYINSSQIIMFKGSSYSAPGTSFDQEYEIPNSLLVSPAPTEVVFTKLTGDVESTANISLSVDTGESKTVSVNEVGTVNVE